VAVWFQNRRAHWKTKQLERDYAALRHSYDMLRADHDALPRDKDVLIDEVRNTLLIPWFQFQGRSSSSRACTPKRKKKILYSVCFVCDYLWNHQFHGSVPRRSWATRMPSCR
jgi:hypothetical protein